VQKGIFDFDRLMELLGFENHKNIFMGSTHRLAPFENLRI